MSAADDVELNVLECRVDILGTNCDQCVSVVQCCFTSTETIRLVRTGRPRTATSTFTQLLNSVRCLQVGVVALLSVYKHNDSVLCELVISLFADCVVCLGSSV